MTQRDRDQSVEQWLRQTPVPGAPADDCLDAETLAAWAEGVLEGPPRAAAEAHASSCARCQAMLAVMVRTTPVAAASAGSPIRKWLMMLGPPMAAAAALALWFAAGQEHRTPVLDSLSQQQAKAEVESAPSPSSAPVPIESDRGAASPSSDAAVESRERAASRTLADARQERETRLDSAAKVAPSAAVTDSNEKKDFAAGKRVDAVSGADRIGAAAPAPVASLPPPPPPAPSSPAESVQAAAGNRAAPSGVAAAPPPQQVSQAQNQAQNQAPNQTQVQAPAQSPAVQRQQGLEERVIVADKPAGAASDSAAASRSGGRAGVAGGVTEPTSLNLRLRGGDFELAAASSTIRWRVVVGRTVQRSPDAGATWSTQYTAPGGVFLTAGVAPSATVCWLVGRAGAVLVFRDGDGWQRVTFPEAVDLVSVIAADARTAAVTTVDGRRFATPDGGRTWTRQ